MKLAVAGYTVIGLARSENKVKELNNNLEPGTKGKIIGRQCDVENEIDIHEAFEWVKFCHTFDYQATNFFFHEQMKIEFGKLDIFINNAGVITNKLVIEDDLQSFRKMFDVNVIAACICLKESVNLMKETTGKGQIIVINSVLGHRVPDVPRSMKPSFGVYPATKHALTALCQTVRQELNFLALPIKLTSISPGMVDTEMLNSMDKELISMLPKLKDEDIADAVFYTINTPERVRIDEIIISPMLC